MALTVNAKSYIADGFQADSVRFQGPANTTSVKDVLIQKKYAPKVTSTSSGNVGFLLKASRTHALTGAKTTVGDGSVDLRFTLPVGISDADRDAYCADIGTYIASAAFKAALKSLQVNG